MQASSRFRIGDTVIVKTHVPDPDLGIVISGWQGTISDINDEYNTVCVDWDSLTLQAMPGSVIATCEEEGLAWNQMYLEVTDVEAAPPRDTPAALAQTVAKLQAQYMWSYLGEEGKRIQAAIGAVDPDDAWAILEAWDTYLRRVLRFPFAAKIAEPQERGPLRTGDHLIVQAITDIDDMYGLIVKMTHQRRPGHFPLCDLEVIDQKSPNYAEVRAYVVWFANR
ncbi:MAG: calcium-binding protein [Roseiflexaceae bacterium]